MNIIKIPFSSGGLGKTKGTELGPDAIAANLEDFFLTEDGREPSFLIHSIPVEPQDFLKTNENIFSHAREHFEKKPEQGVPLFLGGDHSVTYSLVKAFASVNPLNPGIIIFDAHPDCCSDFSPPTHEDLLLALVKEKIISPGNIILVGIRNSFRDELRFLRQHHISWFSMTEIFNEGIQEISEALMAKAKGFGSLYISVDIDALDPAFAPGTGYQEPGGLATRELLFFLQRLKKLKNFKAGDIVEVNPAKDPSGITAKAAAKIVVELA
ncbi:arginase family protein [Candidatus Woesearchaeota archaeon]|nr:arginase family protein [Candidatus Woesearchaeota archaeon]